MNSLDKNQIEYKMFQMWFISKIENQEKLSRITNQANEIVEKEFLDYRILQVNQFVFTASYLYYVGFDSKSINHIIQIGKKYSIMRQSPFFGGKLVTTRIVKELIRNVYSGFDHLN
jgi:hypothetical protein